MVKRLRFLLIVLCFVILPTAAARAVDVSAVVDRTRLADGESLTLTVSISGGKGEVDVNGIRDFEVVSRSTSSSYNIINGKVSSKTEYLFTLMPLKKGRLLIPPLPVTVGRQTMYTEMIAVDVETAGRSGSEARETADVFCQLSVSKNDPFLGEQIVCRLSLFSAIPIANGAVTRLPDFPGFSAQKLQDNRTFSKIIDGRRFNVTELVFVLTPESDGAHTIGPATISCDVVTARSRRGRSLFDSFFDDPFLGGVQSLSPRRLTAEPITVTVRPLPDYTGDMPFSGLVGEFAIAAEVDRTDIAAGDSCNVIVTVSGRGNIQSAAGPAFDLSDAFKVYTDTPTEEVVVDETGMSGKKHFAAALVALRPGTYTLGPFPLTYFDVRRRSYVTIATAPIEVVVGAADKEQNIDGGGSGVATPGLSTPAFRQQAVEFTGHDIFPLATDLSALEHDRPLSLTTAVLLITGPFFLYGLAVLIMTRLRRKADNVALMSRKARAYLKNAGRERNAVTERLDWLHKAVVYAVNARAGRRGESLTYREARQLLQAHGCEASLTDQVSRLLETVEQARYGGRNVDPAYLKETLTSAAGLIRRTLP